MKTSIELEIKEVKTYRDWLKSEVLNATGDSSRKGFVYHALLKIEELTEKIHDLIDKQKTQGLNF